MNTTTHPTESARSRSRKIWTAVRGELRERRQDRAEFRALERDLASYNTRAEVDDLLGSIRAAEGPDAERIRLILSRNLHRNQLAS
jgi:hypothetical protein